MAASSRIAARAHVEALMPLVEAALADAKLTLADVDAIAATAGPGLIGGVSGRPRHRQGARPCRRQAAGGGQSSRGPCALAAPRRSGPSISHLLLLVSGGHCQLLGVRGVGNYRRLGTTIDDAAGEDLRQDREAAALGIPGGPRVEALAREGDPKAATAAAPAARYGRAAFLLRGPQERGHAGGRIWPICAVPTSPRASSRPWSIAWSTGRGSRSTSLARTHPFVSSEVETRQA